MSQQNKWAVIRIRNKQYRVVEGEEILVDKLRNVPEPEVLLLIKDESVSVGKPILKDVKVKFKIIDEEVKGEKIEVLKFRAKSRYRKKIGFRPIYSKLLIEKIF